MLRTKQHVGKDLIIYIIGFVDMTEKEGIKQAAFWDVSENTGVEPEVTTDESDNTAKEFQPHEPREKTSGTHLFDVFTQIFIVGFALLFAFSFVEDTWHVFPWECPNEVVDAGDGTFQCQHSGIIETQEYDSSGLEIVEPMEKIIGVMMYFILLFLSVLYCWARFSKKHHLRHLGEENTIVIMTSRFGKIPKINNTIHLQPDSFIQRTTKQFTDQDGDTSTSSYYEIQTQGQKPVELSRFSEEDYAYVTGLEIRR